MLHHTFQDVEKIDSIADAKNILLQLSKNSDHFEVRTAAKFLVENVTEKTTSQRLEEYINNVAKLIPTNTRVHNDIIIYQNCVEALRVIITNKSILLETAEHMNTEFLPQYKSA